MPHRLLILIAEADEASRRHLCERLHQSGFETFESDNGYAVQALALALRPAAVIMEVSLPGRDGLEACRMLRKDEETKTISVLLLTQLAHQLDRLAGFRAGADDYVVKPYDEEELILRLEALLRRSAKRGDLTRFKVGPFEFDFTALRMTLDGQEKLLSKMEFKLLNLLVSKMGRVVDRDVIISVVWPRSDESKSRSLDTHIKRLRAKLHPHGDWLKTARGRGYEFSAPNSD